MGYKAKSKMRKVMYNGYTIYEVRAGCWRVGMPSDRGYYAAFYDTLQKAKEHVDRLNRS